MVIRSTIKRLDVNISASSAGESFKEVVCELRLKVTYQASAYFRVHHGDCPSTEIEPMIQAFLPLLPDLGHVFAGDLLRPPGPRSIPSTRSAVALRSWLTS